MGAGAGVVIQTRANSGWDRPVYLVVKGGSKGLAKTPCAEGGTTAKQFEEAVVKLTSVGKS